jgi:peroxiredoxin
VSLKNFAPNFFGACRKGALAAGETAPPISLSNLEGETVSLAEALKNGPVIAAFFKVTCRTSQFTFPYLERIFESYGGGNVTFWAVSQNDAEDTREFLDRCGVKFPALLDKKGYPVSNQYGLTSVPTIFVIGTDGKIEVNSVGFSRSDLEKLNVLAARATGKPEKSVFAPGENVPEHRPG